MLLTVRNARKDQGRAANTRDASDGSATSNAR